MSEQHVKDVYNTLFRVESKIKPTTYPIHKRLNLDADFNDLYDWIFANIDLPQEGKILDAGCGVGYGSFYLSDRTNCSALGISLSEKEVALANAISKEKGLEDRVKFKVQSFDEPLSDKYDLIIAVESLKHTMNLETSLKNLQNSLTLKGKIIIVEDFFTGKKEGSLTNTLAKDWVLKEIFSVENYTEYCPSSNYKSTLHDLNPFMVEKNIFSLWSRYILLSFLTSVGAIFGKGKFWKIMRGGLALDILYAQNEMAYQVLEIEKI